MKRANVSLPATRSLDGKVVGARAQNGRAAANVLGITPVFVRVELELPNHDNAHTSMGALDRIKAAAAGKRDADRDADPRSIPLLERT